MYIQDEVVWRALSLAVFATAAITDFFDGYIARNYNAQTKYGVFLDPLADKFLTFAGFVCLPFIDPVQFPWWAVFLIVIRDISVTVFRLYADRKEIAIDTRFTAKLKTLVQMIFLYIVLILGVFLQAEIQISYYAFMLMDTGIMYWLMLFVTALTVYSGVEYFIVNKSVFSTDESI
jgi:CDP-diacylglycerol--glycerol-3-phosphate 3-phosphatidyltransferase